MKESFITEAEKHTEIAGKYDVIVAGSGPSGFAAAVTAARNGAKTLIIEAQSGVGGISTSGLMSHFTGFIPWFAMLLKTATAFAELLPKIKAEGGHTLQMF